MSRPRASGQFLAGTRGPLATVVWEPPEHVQSRFAVLYVPPFGDEMNKSRRMAALQARSFAATGAVVALLDPFGTGDSGGDHGEATWVQWQDDVLRAWEWLGTHCDQPRVIWGARLGALLAVELVSTARLSPAATVLWQPVPSGRAFFTQLLRLATVQQLAAIGAGGNAVRATLATGSAVEVGGYELNPALVAGAEAIDLAGVQALPSPVVWRETSSAATPALSPATAAIAARWNEHRVDLDVAAVSGPSFWATQEIAEAPELIAATTAAVVRLFPVERGATP